MAVSWLPLVRIFAYISRFLHLLYFCGIMDVDDRQHSSDSEEESRPLLPKVAHMEDDKETVSGEEEESMVEEEKAHILSSEWFFVVKCLAVSFFVFFQPRDSLSSLLIGEGTNSFEAESYHLDTISEESSINGKQQHFADADHDADLEHGEGFYDSLDNTVTLVDMKLTRIRDKWTLDVCYQSLCMCLYLCFLGLCTCRCFSCSRSSPTFFPVNLEIPLLLSALFALLFLLPRSHLPTKLSYFHLLAFVSLWCQLVLPLCDMRMNLFIAMISRLYI